MASLERNDLFGFRGVDFGFNDLRLSNLIFVFITQLLVYHLSIEERIWYSAGMKSSQIKSLNKWNKGLAVLHFVQAVAVLLLAKNILWPITTSYLTVDTVATKVAGNPVLAPASSTLFNVNLAYFVVTFFLMSSLAHTIIATKYRKTYEANLAKGINKARWIEYGFSASVMMVAIALLSGVYDVSSLIMIFILDLLMNSMGLVMEINNQGKKKVDWLPFWIGCLAGIIPWIVFAIYVAGATINGSGGIPTFVYFIYASMFAFFSSFAVNMYLQYTKKGKWADYLYGERVYMILSLVAKSVLAWQVFFGTLRP